MKILDEFYYDNITPTEEIIHSKEFDITFKKFIKQEDEFILLLNNKQKEKYDELSCIQRSWSCISDKEIFISGFRLGGRFVMDILHDKN